jgi:predicted TIM-barrel enzyme
MIPQSRTQIIDHLRHKIADNQPIIMGGAGIGLVAKAADRAGIDILMAYNTGPLRMDGHPSLSGYLAYSASNDVTLALARKILPVVENTPVVAGIGAADPYQDIDRLITEMMDLGYSGITNVPTAGAYRGEMRAHIDHTGLGYPREVELIRKCRQQEIFTVAYAFTPEECRMMAEAGADVIGTHVYTTRGGMKSVRDDIVPDLKTACLRTEEMCRAAREGRDDVILVSHGGPFQDPESIQYSFDHTSVHGYLGASTIERIPVEKAVSEIIQEFLALKIVN